MRKLATIRQIIDIQDIEGADRIKLATVDGWKTIIKKDEMEIGDYGVYFEIDSLIPDRNDVFAFLKTTKKFEGRVWKFLKTIRLRGQISQGLLLPLSVLPKVKEIVGDNPQDFLDYDFSESLGIVKYEPPSELVVSSDSKGTYPSYVRKTGEERIQNVFAKYKERYADVEFVPTLKMDGSSITVCYVNNPTYFVGHSEDNEGLTEQVWVGSHNHVLKAPLEIDGVEIVRPSGFYSAVDSVNLGERLADWCRENNTQIAIQGELLGPKIQGNFEKFNQFTMRAFYVYFIEEARRATPTEFIRICNEIGIETVKHYEPIKVFQVFSTVDEVLDFAEGKSEFNPIREGLVFKADVMRNGEPVSFKAISNSFLLRKSKKEIQKKTLRSLFY